MSARRARTRARRSALKRSTGRPNSVSHCCARRTDTRRYEAISFHEDSSSAGREPGGVREEVEFLRAWPWRNAPGRCYGRVFPVRKPTGTAADLVVSVFSVPVTGAECSQVNVTDTTRNSGTGTSLPSTTKYFFSVDGTYSAEDEPIGSRIVPSLPPLAVDTGTTTVTLPCSPARAGTFYVLAIADAENAVAESRETNNLLAKSIKIGGDLVVYTITAVTTARACYPITLDDTTKNSGLGAASGSTTRCYLSIDSALQPWDVPLESGRPVGALAPGMSDGGSRSVTIPCNAAPRSYLICAADADGQAVEFNKANNTKAKAITIIR